MGWQQDSKMVSKGGDQGQCVQPADKEMQISSIHPIFSCQEAFQLREIQNFCGPLHVQDLFLDVNTPKYTLERKKGTRRNKTGLEIALLYIRYVVVRSCLTLQVSGTISGIKSQGRPLLSLLFDIQTTRRFSRFPANCAAHGSNCI